jgi:hypothetical protein
MVQWAAQPQHTAHPQTLNQMYDAAQGIIDICDMHWSSTEIRVKLMRSLLQIL